MTINVPPTPPPVAVRVRTDHRVYKRGDRIGIRILITNERAETISISLVSVDRPEYESQAFLAHPGGSIEECKTPELDADGPLTVTRLFQKIQPGQTISLPGEPFRWLSKWGCNVNANGSYTLYSRRWLLDYYTGGRPDIDAPPVTFNVVGS